MGTRALLTGAGQPHCPNAAAVNSNGAINPGRMNRKPAVHQVLPALGFVFGRDFIIRDLRRPDLPVLSAVLPINLKRILFFWEKRGGDFSLTGLERRSDGFNQ
jgi:hypothetical protein